MWPRMRIDMPFHRWVAAAWRCRFVDEAERSRKRIEMRHSGPTGHALACLSVRSGLDLLLQSLECEPGSEVLLSAITVSDMAEVVLQSGGEPHTVDVHPADLLPTLEALEAARTRHTRVLVVAHLFGLRSSLAEIGAWCKSHGILLVEDAAQAYAGQIDPDPAADVTMYSFGLIKTATAVGGALVCVRDADLAGRMRDLERTWPTQDPGAYRAKVHKAGFLLLLGIGPVFGACAWIARRIGMDLDRKLYDATRGFPGDGLMKQLRQRPCAPLLANLNASLRADVRARVARRAENGDRVGYELMHAVPGMHVPSRIHWVLPFRVTDRNVVVADLREAGFDVAPRSSLSVIPAAPGRDAPRIAEELLDSLIFLPCYAGMPRSEADRMARVLGGEGSK